MNAEVGALEAEIEFLTELAGREIIKGFDFGV